MPQPAATLRSFADLTVYQLAMDASIRVLREVIPHVPAVERDDLADQLRRSAKAVPRLIAEGYAKRHQAKGFQKYLDDATQESNEMIVSLTHVREGYGVCPDLTGELIQQYDRISRSLYNLAAAWANFGPRRPKSKPSAETLTHLPTQTRAGEVPVNALGHTPDAQPTLRTPAGTPNSVKSR